MAVNNYFPESSSYFISNTTSNDADNVFSTKDDKNIFNAEQVYIKFEEKYYNKIQAYSRKIGYVQKQN